MVLFQNSWGPKKVVVIFVHLNKEGNSYCAVAARSKNTIGQNDPQQFDSIEEIIKSHGNSTAYWLNIVGNGVISRLVDRATGYKDDIIINGDKDEFLFSSYTDGERSVVSFVRKNTIEQILETLQKLKAHLINISCGSVPVFQLLVENDSISLDYIISKKNNFIESFTRNENKSENTQFKDEFVTEKQVIAASICAFLQQPLEGFDFCWTPEEQKKTRDEYRQHRKFNVLGVTSLVGILVFVLVNYFYVNHLNDQIVQLETDLSMSNDNLSLLDQLEQEKMRKEQLIETSGFLGNKFISFYLDKIGKSVPATIYLKNMVVFPAEEKLKEKRKVTVDTKKIEIQGLTNSSVVFDDWIEKMDRFAWVQSVEVMNYTKINESQAEFKLIMLLSK
jgi:Tfp pilus assembly protein PilN